MRELKKFCVTTKVYVWARDSDNAVNMVSFALDYETEFGKSDICGFISPTTTDAVEIKEV